MYLDPVAFNRFLADMGQTADWRRAQACPCRNARSGAARPDCPKCAGLGYWWDEPITCEVAFSGQKVQQQWANFGLWENGDQVVTLAADSPAYAMARMDRIVMRQSSVPFDTILKPGQALRWAQVQLARASWFVGNKLVEVNNPRADADGQPILTDPAPPADAQIALSGRHAPEYFAFQDYPQDRAHHHGRALPRRVVLRKFDLFGRH